jgi:membrane-associated phospholipid phosphatase
MTSPMRAPGEPRSAITGFGPPYWRQVRRNLVIVVPWTSFLYIGYQLTNRYQLFPVYTLPASALTVAVLINYSIFLVFPTVLERPPLPTGDSLADELYRWLIGIDTPANCFPSGHITAPAIGCWFLARQRLRWWPAITVAYAVLAISVLTTKQHYAIDIAGGAATAAIGIATASRLRAHGVWLAGAA